MKKLSELDFCNEPEISFGIPEDIPESEQERLPVIINGKEYSYTDIELLQAVRDINGSEFYRIDIQINPELRHKGLGYKIYKKYVEEMGNIISIKAYRFNETEIPKIYSKLAQTPGITVIKEGDNYLAYMNWWKEKHNIDNINLGEIEI